MSETVNEIETKIREIQDGINQVSREMGPALQNAVDKIFSRPLVPEYLKNRALNKAREASHEFSMIPPKTDPQIEIVMREINDYRAVAQTGPQYCAVEFEAAAAALGPSQLGPRGDDWDSGNTNLYRTAVHSLPTKLQNLRDAVKEICNILADLKEDYDSFFTGLLVTLISASLAILSLIAAIAGLVAAIPTGGAGLVVAIVGVVLAVLGAGAALASFFTLTDIDAARATAAQRLREAATSVRNSVWPPEPALDGASW